MKALTLSAAVLLGVVTASRAEAGDAVKLLFARSAIGWDGHTVNGYIEVQDYAYQKAVSVVYRFNNEPWKVLAATYVGPTHGTLEAWQFNTNGVRLGYKESGTIEFALRYEVLGKTYWDNNGGRNYQIGFGFEPSFPTFVLERSQVVLDYAGANTETDSGGVITGKSIQGGIWVKQFGAGQVVRVVYSRDGWKTSTAVDASFTRLQGSDTALWNFKFDVPKSTKEIVFVAMTGVGNYAAWDNNFRRNYTLGF
jgi:hypothetical protein